MIIGDVGNRVHILSKNEEEPTLQEDRKDRKDLKEKYSYKSIIDVNDCVLYTALHNNLLVISTKQGVYLFQI